MAETSIEWTDRSINPIRARHRNTGAIGHYCELCSSGCAHCYASNFQKRFGMPAFPGKARLETLPLIDERGCVIVNEDIELFLDETKLQEVLARRKPCKWFWCDMTDMFGYWVPFEWINRCFAVMAVTPQHTHQVLTKRAERLAEYCSKPTRFWDVVHRHLIGPTISTHDDVEAWCKKNGISREERERRKDLLHYDADGNYRMLACPLPNVWLGVSVEDQKRADERIPHLVNCPAAVRFLSCEPLLGAVNLTRISVEDKSLSPGDRDYPAYSFWSALDGFRGHKGGGWQSPHKIDWVIAGGESGPGSRPCRPEWIRSIVQQCKAAGVACFVKQMGANVITRNDQIEDEFNNGESGWPDPDVEHDIHGFRENYQGADCRIRLKDKKGGDIEEFPLDLRVREFPKQ